MQNPSVFPHGYTEKSDGMKLLDYFAAMAMQGELASQDGETGQYSDYDMLASRSYGVAVAMLKEKERLANLPLESSKSN